MNGITNLQTTVQNFQLGYNSLVKKCSQLEVEVRQNREYIIRVTEDLNTADKVATTVYNVVKVAELYIQKVHSTIWNIIISINCIIFCIKCNINKDLEGFYHITNKWI